jgi:hypothetical protein
VASVDEAQRAQLGPGLAVVGDCGGVVPVLQAHGGLQPRGPGPEQGAGGLPPGHLVGQDQLEELGMSHAAGASQRKSLGQGVEAPAELSAAASAAEM